MAVPKSLYFKNNSTQPLSCLDFSGWYDRVDDAALSTAAARCGTTLTALNLDQCGMWTAVGMRDVVRSCPNLRYLSMSRCTGADEDTLQWVGQHCRRLTHLCLSFCLNVTAEGLRNVSANTRSLQMVDLEGCDRLDSAGVAALLLGCRKLRGLRLCGIRKLDSAVAEVSLSWLSLARKITCAVFWVCSNSQELQTFEYSTSLACQLSIPSF